MELYNDKEENEPLEDKFDNFSDVEDLDESFIVNLETVKNITTTSNFQFKINIKKIINQLKLLVVVNMRKIYFFEKKYITYI
jgi:hypothetical protein